MTAAEWKPINPCLKCEPNQQYDNCELTCDKLKVYKSAVEYQQKLLKYLKEEHYLGASVVDPMLKDLEEEK
jgi:hypothetical protein